MSNVQEATLFSIKDLLAKAQKLLQEYDFIPFGNSTVQNIFLMVQDEFSDGRKLRSYLCKLSDRLQALEHNYYRLREEEIKLKKLKRKLETETDELERELIEVRIQKSLSTLKYIKKLYLDALQEVSVLVHGIELLPNKPKNRIEFEKQEIEHFQKRLMSYLNEPDAIRALKAIGCEIVTDNNQRVQVVMKEEFKRLLNEVLSSDVTNELKALLNKAEPEQVLALAFDNTVEKINELVFDNEEHVNVVESDAHPNCCILPFAKSKLFAGTENN